MTPPLVTTVYGQPSCMQCKATTRELTKLGVPYTYIDLTEDPDALQFVRTLGHTQAPIITVTLPDGLAHWSGVQQFWMCASTGNTNQQSTAYVPCTTKRIVPNVHQMVRSSACRGRRRSHDPRNVGQREGHQAGVGLLQRRLAGVQAPDHVPRRTRMATAVKEIEVDRVAADAAHHAFQMEDPDPRGYISGTMAARMRRALWAYEWGKANKRDAGQGYVYLFTPGEVRDAVLAMEADPDR